jgi:hypothetical protein
MRRRKSAVLEAPQEDAHMLHAWRAFHREELNTALHGPHGGVVAQLVDVLGALGLKDGAALIDFINSQRWHGIPASIRLVCLHEINTWLTAMREKHGLAPFDDALPGERLNAFLIIKQLMGA